MGFVYPFKHHLEGLKPPLFRKKRELLEQKGLKNILVHAWSWHIILFDMVAKLLLLLYCDSVNKLLV